MSVSMCVTSLFEIQMNIFKGCQKVQNMFILWKVQAVSASRRFQMVQKVSRRFKKNEEGSKSVIKIQKSLKCSKILGKR